MASAKKRSWVVEVQEVGETGGRKWKLHPHGAKLEFLHGRKCSMKFLDAETAIGIGKRDG